MSDDLLKQILDHVIELKEGQASIGTTVDSLHNTVNGNGQPGLVQKVEDLQAAKNWTWGVGTALSFIAGLGEWLFHKH